MSPNFSPASLFLLAALAIGVYFLVILAFNKKILALVGIVTRAKPGSTTALHHESFAPPHDILPPIIDKPANHPSEQAGLFQPFDDDDDEGWEMIDNNENILLKEAEQVVADIQTTVNKLESSPPNPQEVRSKIAAIVSLYTFFKGTEYYDAINSFIAVTVQRDCQLNMSADEIRSLWNRQAA